MKKQESWQKKKAWDYTVLEVEGVNPRNGPWHRKYILVPRWEYFLAMTLLVVNGFYVAMDIAKYFN